MALPLLVFLLSFALGRYPVSPGELVAILASKILPIEHTWPVSMEAVVFQIRLPRILAAMLIGLSLSTAGAAYQGMFRNPLVSPDILGASAGAAFGAAFGIFFSFSLVGIQLSSFFFGLLAVLLVYFIGSRVRFDPTLVLVLAGILISTLFSSGTSLIKYLADPLDKLPAITFWLMGSLTAINMTDVYVATVPIVLSVLPLFVMRWRLNVLSLGDEEARALGLDTRKLRLMVILCATLMTSTAVSISGMIGWVGLIIPHLARLLVGPNYRSLIPASILIGSAYLLVVDDLARSLAQVEIPLGILTSVIGAPFFLYLLLGNRKGWT